MLAIDMLKSHQWPLWNPYILAGTPLLANFQSAPFSPTNFVYWMFDRLTAWSVQIMLQHFLAAVFTYLLLRAWKVSKLGSVIGGVIYAFAGFNLIWSQWNGHTLSAAFIPLLLLLVYMWVSEKKWRALPLFSISIAAQILSGYPQVVLYTTLTLGLYWLFLFEEKGGFFLRTIILAVFGLLGLGLSAFQTLPGKELLNLSQREVEPHPFEWAFLPFSKVVTFFAPDFYGNHSTQNYWGPQDYTSNTGFVGTISLVLGTFAALSQKTKQIVFLLVLLTLSLVLSFPTPVSIFLWKSGLFGLNAASAHRALVLFNLSIALLAGFGTDIFRQEKRVPAVKAYLLPVLVIVGFGIWAGIMWRLSSLHPNLYPSTVRGIEKYTVGLRNLAWPGMILIGSFIIVWWGNLKKGKSKTLCVSLLLALICADLFRFGWKFTPFSPRNTVFPLTPVLDYLSSQAKPFRTTGATVIPINMRMPYKIETIEGYDAVYPLEISRLIASISGGKSGTDPVGRYGIIGDETKPILNLMNVKYDLVIKRDAQNKPGENGSIPKNFTAEKFQVAFEDKSVAILENKNTLPRAFMVFNYEVAAGNIALDRMLADTFQFGKTTVLERDLKQNFNSVGKSTVLFKDYNENSSILGVNTDSDGLLFVSDTYYPGWHVFVDGVEKNIIRADFAFRAVEIPQGVHQVKFIYKPDSFYSSLKIAGVSALMLILSSFASWVVGKRKTSIYT